MVVKQEGNRVNVKFDSIADFVSYLRKTEETQKYRGKARHSHMTGSSWENFSGTKNYEEAENLLLNGWESGTRDLLKKMGEAKNKVTEYKNKPCYSVAGYQACVPRYLQGIPDSMIYTKKVKQKQKVINIIKDVGYAVYVKKEDILFESVKVLRLVESLEKQGYRVNLYIGFALDGGWSSSYNMRLQIKIKSSSQRLNIKQVAFPLIHPSMVRRIMMSFIEKCPYTKDYGIGHGCCTDDNTFKQSFKGLYCIPRVVHEEQITDIEKYYSK